MITRNRMFALRFLLTVLAGLFCAASSGAQQLSIESPASGTVFSAGQTINVTVSVTNGSVVAVQVFGRGMGTTAMQYAAPFTFTLTAPGNVIGPQNVLAVGALGQGDAVFSPTVAVDIEPASAPTSIVFNQSLATLGYVGDQRRVGVSATFADGSTQDVSNSTNLTYSSSTPTVTSIDSTGLMTCQGIGSAAITATYGTLTTTLQTQGPSGVPGDLNGDFVVNSDDLALLELSLGATPTLPGDGRNLDGDTTIDAGDVKDLLVICGSACPSLSTTTTALAGVPAQIAYAQSLQLTAMVTGSGTTKPSGGVAFLVDGKVEDVGVFNSPNEAYVTLTSLAAGSHTIEAMYEGDTSNAPSTSTSATTQVLAPVLASIDVLPAIPTVAPGATQQFTAIGSYTDASTQNQTTSVTWTSQTPSVATIAASTGLATAVAPGTTQITATVSGIASPPVTLTVAAAALITPTVTVTLSPTSITTAQSTMVTVTISGGSGNPTPTGSVTLTSGTYTSAATTLTSGSAVITVPGSSLAATTDTLTATYTPDSNSTSTYNSAMGTNTVIVTAAPAPTFALTNNGNISIVAGAATGNTSTITVTPSNGFTGAVALTCAVTTAPTGATSPATCGVTPSVTINGTSLQNATLTVTTTTTTTAGAYAVTVTGTSSAITMSTTVNVTVTAYIPPSFALSNGGPITISSPGSTTGNTTAITVTPSGGFTGNVTLTAVLASGPTGATDPPTFSFGATSPVTITGASNGTGTLTVTTTAATSGALVRPKSLVAPWYAAGGTALACLLFFGIPARRRRWRTMVGMFALLALLTGGLVSCGSKSGSDGGGNSGTTTGTYTITVTGTSGSIMQTTTVTLTVN